MTPRGLCWLPLICVLGCRSSSAADRAAPAAASAPSSAPAPARRAPPPRCPKGMLTVDAFCIDRFEAHLVHADDPRIVHSPFERPKPNVVYAAASAAGVVPQGYVSRLEAAAACEAAGKRLCRAAEWYRACSGKRGLRYPYGEKEERGRCNTGKGHVLTQLFGRVPLTYDAHYNNPRVNREPGFLARTGAYSGCVSPEGALDLVGNLHEWVADDVSARLEDEIPLEKGDHWLGKRGMGVFMGGYYSSTTEHGRGCLYVTATHAPDYHDYSTGFRCCAEREKSDRRRILEPPQP